MFTGIIEAMGMVTEVISNGSNKSFWVESSISRLLKPDQSLCHDGVCLTVETIEGTRHKVTAVDETLKKTTLKSWTANRMINLERCLQLNGRLDGHIVQGHVDAVATCIKRKEKKGSREFEFAMAKQFAPLLIEKGSVAINGISLTAYNVKKKSFTVTIIPYTFEHTNMGDVVSGSLVNIEFDILGKYIYRRLKLR